MYCTLLTIWKEDIFLATNDPQSLSVVQLVFESGVGTAVLVRCFVNKKSMETEIIDRLGNGFTRPPFATVVVHSYQTCYGPNIIYLFVLLQFEYITLARILMLTLDLVYVGCMYCSFHAGMYTFG